MTYVPPLPYNETSGALVPQKSMGEIDFVNDDPADFHFSAEEERLLIQFLKLNGKYYQAQKWLAKYRKIQNSGHQLFQTLDVMI